MSAPRSTSSRLASLIQHLALALILMAVFLHGIIGPLPADNLRMQIVLGVAALAWLVACSLGLRGYGSGRMVVAGAISLQLLALVGEPSLSDDIYRYVWEGRLVSEGTSPYAHAPDSEALAGARRAFPALYARVNHPEVSAAYPPLTQYAFAGLVKVAEWLPGYSYRGGLGAVFVMRVFFALCAVLVLVPLFSLLDRAGKPRSAAVAWAWSPLVALEFAGSGHFDSFGILLLFAGLALWTRPRHERSHVDDGVAIFALSAAALVKIFPGVAVLFALRERPRAKLFAWALFGLTLSVLLVLAFRERTAGIFAGLSTYGRTWEGGSLVHRWLDFGLRAFKLPFHLNPQLVGRAVLGLVWLVCLLVAWRKRLGPVRASGFLIAAFLLLSPTLHPWYVTWVMPFLALRPSWAFRFLVVLAPLLYWPLAGWQSEGVWEEPVWLAPTLSGVVLGLLVLENLVASARNRTIDAPLAVEPA